MAKQPATEEQSIEHLQKRYNDLNTRKIQAETNLKNAKNQLEQLQSQAREKYGTDDVEALRKQLDELKSENERKRREYQSNLDKIEQDLAKVDQNFADAASASLHEQSDTE